MTTHELYRNRMVAGLCCIALALISCFFLLASLGMEGLPRAVVPAGAFLLAAVLSFRLAKKSHAWDVCPICSEKRRAGQPRQGQS